MTIVQLKDHQARTWVPGIEGLLLRIRDLAERGRVDVGDIRLRDLVRWILELARPAGGSPARLSELCGALEGAARLALLKARRLNGMWQSFAEEEGTPWAGPPPELALQKSWFAGRIAAGPLSFVGPPRRFETMAAQLAPISPDRLRGAMLAVIGRQRPVPMVTRTQPTRVSLESRAALILERLATHGEVVLDQIAGETRDAQIATFLACLTLSRQGSVSLRQDELFGAILVRRAEDTAMARVG